jgi:hypothetical protein
MRLRISLLLLLTLSMSFSAAQNIELQVLTARGNSVVYADSIYGAQVVNSVANSNGFFHFDFKAPGFDGAFNLPINYQGELSADERVQPTFRRKDAHFAGVVSLILGEQRLTLLTKSPKEITSPLSVISKGLRSQNKQKQQFVADLTYQTYTYDEARFVKRDYIVRLHVEMPVTINWNVIGRKWVPEGLPTPVDADIGTAVISDEIGPETESTVGEFDTTAADLNAPQEIDFAPTDTTTQADEN